LIADSQETGLVALPANALESGIIPVEKPYPVVHVEIRGLESQELQSFYRDIFGWDRDDSLSIEDYSVGEVQGDVLTAGVGPVPDWSANASTFFIQVDDIQATLEKIEACGGKAVMPRTEGPVFGAHHILVFTKFMDPAGNVVGLVERQAQSGSFRAI
jgi:predicted enzyme related to lactoylglutathione lyase